jgi:hypothetical protein
MKSAQKEDDLIGSHLDINTAASSQHEETNGSTDLGKAPFHLRIISGEGQA